MKRVLGKGIVPHGDTMAAGAIEIQRGYTGRPRRLKLDPIILPGVVHFIHASLTTRWEDSRYRADDLVAVSTGQALPPHRAAVIPLPSVTV